MSPRISWEGVFPAVTTQFNDDLSLNIDATAKVMDGLIRDGVSGLIVCGWRDTGSCPFHSYSPVPFVGRPVSTAGWRFG